jgi:uncharacterized sporulation protein YeaH/YhbH (DUF444 family)
VKVAPCLRRFFGRTGEIHARENFMTVRIVDRRFDSKNKSSVNRSRFIRRFKGQIRKAVSEALNHRGVRDLENGEKIGIPGGDIAEPHLPHGPGGKREVVNPGNDRFTSGDQVDRPQGGGAGQGGGQASQEGEGLDDFVFNLTRDEFLDIFFRRAGAAQSGEEPAGAHRAVP